MRRLIGFIRLRWEWLPIRYKLLTGFSASFLMVLCLGMSVTYLVVLKTVERNTEDALQHGTEAIHSIVKAGTDATIRNYLRAVGEKNLDIIASLHRRAEHGEISLDEAMASAKAILQSQSIGTTGYIFVWDIQNAPTSIPLVVHPVIQGKDVAYVDFVQSGASQKTGYVEYKWSNPGEPEARDKAMYLAHFEPWHWVIAVSSYRSEFTELVKSADFRDRILAMKFGDSGYSYILDGKGNTVVHPYLTGNLLNLTDADGIFIAREICARKSGRLIYNWMDPGEAVPRRKIVAFSYIPELDWVIASSGYFDELYAPLLLAQRIIIIALMLSLMLIVPMSLWMSRGLARPIRELAERLRASVPMHATPVEDMARGDEISLAAAFFDTVIARLDAYNRTLWEDVLEQKLAREQIWKLSEFQESVIENANVWISVMNAQGRVVIWNRAAEEMSGYSRAEAMNTGEIWSLLTPNLQDGGEGLLSSLALGRSAFQSTVRTRDGACRTILWYMRELRGQDGAPTGTIALGVDLTEQTRALDGLSQAKDQLLDMNRRLGAEKERIATTLRSIGDGVITVNRDGVIEIMNRTAERITGQSAEGAAGRVITEILPLRDAKSEEFLGERLMDAVRSGILLELERDVLVGHTDGTDTHVAVASSPIRDEAGAIAGSVMVIRDVSERILLEQEILKRSKIESLGVFAGGIAHDFNNLLTGVIGNISLAKKEMSPDDHASELLGDAESICLRARGLTQQLLTFSHGGGPVKKTITLDTLIVETASFVLRGSSVRPACSIQKGLWSVEADEGQIAQVIHNLVLNGRQAMPNGGTISVSASNEVLGSHGKASLAPGNYVRVTVVDPGVGIAPEHLASIFDPYFTTKETGNGLGLAVCYSIIRNHQGQIFVRSTVGQGTVIDVYLPAASAAVAAPEERRSPAQVGNGTVLVMDDEDFILDLVEHMLRQLGLDMVRAGSGMEAVELYRNARLKGGGLDLLIMDLTIPGGMGGKEAAEILRREFPDVKMIVSSGYSNDPVMASYRDYGFSGVLVKPYRCEDLATLLAEVLNS